MRKNKNVKDMPHKIVVLLSRLTSDDLGLRSYKPIPTR
jgi:hypothetical protein